ncbi:MAG: DinB family protein [Frankiaceae bacterium]|nr:DinB family protein [Frankiaceae bacterium]
MSDITPDAKDWTWVITQPCPDCALNAASVEYDEIPGRIRDNAASWVEVLARPDVRDRPQPGVWSPLEYACHVRDVFVLFDQRLVRMLTEDDPLFANWDQDETAVQEKYAEQDPVVVAQQIPPAAEQLATRFAQVTDRARVGGRSDGAVFTIESFARYLLHDPVHHLHDVQRA